MQYEVFENFKYLLGTINDINLFNEGKCEDTKKVEVRPPTLGYPLVIPKVIGHLFLCWSCGV